MLENKVLSNIYEKYRENKLAHAYLIETNDIERATSEIKELIKALNCPHQFEQKCNKCNLCNLINKNNLPSLIEIEPDGTNIKKNQIEDLKKRFDSIPIYAKYNIYIIKNAEKLNANSANAMLKFIEEPTEGILGFFITSNKDVMIDTIKSRCQSYILNFETKSIIEKLNITDEEYNEYIEIIKNYLDLIEKRTFINHKKVILQVFPERIQIINLLKIILEIYYNTFLKQNGLEYQKEMAEIFTLNEKDQVLKKKIKIISKILQELSYNVSIELILDKFVIEMRGSNE